MTEIIPTIGRIVEYTVSADDAAKINKRRKDASDHMDEHRNNSNGVMVHVGNDVHEGDVFPAKVVRVWGNTPDAPINLQVALDGSDTFWATSRHVGEGPGTYQWMKFQLGQAAKTEAVQKSAADASEHPMGKLVLAVSDILRGSYPHLDVLHDAASGKRSHDEKVPGTTGL